MEIRRFTTIAAVSLFSLYSLAQSVSEIQDKINDIKQDVKFIKAESTAEDVNEAFMGASNSLLYELNMLRMEQGKEDLAMSDIHPLLEMLKHERGNFMRVFVYADKEKLMSVVSRHSSGQPAVQVESAQQSTSSTASVSQSVQQVQSTQTVQTIQPAQSVQQNTSSAQTNTHSVNRPTFVSASGTPAAVQNDVLASLALMDTYTDVSKALVQFRNEGKVKTIEKCNALKDITSSKYLVMFTRDTAIQAILKPNANNTYTNIKTGKEDSRTNYQGCFILMFEM